MALAPEAWRIVCRASYYISLLGLKIPLGLLVRASRARWVLAFLILAWVPFLACCHAVLLPRLHGIGAAGVAVWHAITAVWVTLPLLVVGAVIHSVARSAGLFATFSAALACVACFHGFAIPAIAGTRLGGVLLHALFAVFEDAPIAVWIWCLVHVVRLQRHVEARQAGRASPFAPEGGARGEVLVVGNAPTVTDGEPLGAAIDGFAEVVRFNTYSVARPEYTGSKVSFHFCNGRNFPASSAVKAICPLFNASLTHAVYLFMPHAEEAAEIYSNLTSSRVDAWFVGEEEILALRRRIGCRLWQIPTSGMVAIDGVLSHRSGVTLHGFNFFQGKKIHYFEESPTQLITSWLERFVTHDPSREKRWVEGLLREGRAGFLARSTPAPAPREDMSACQAALAEKTEKASEAEAAKLERAGKKAKGLDGEPRRRPGLLQTLLKDGLPSQFSL